MNKKHGVTEGHFVCVTWTVPALVDLRDHTCRMDREPVVRVANGRRNGRYPSTCTETGRSEVRFSLEL